MSIELVDSKPWGYDAVLVISFGGPEGPDEVMPFLQNVLRGHNVPYERVLEVSHHYELFDGVSPINGQNRALVAAVEQELRAHNVNLPVYWGNRNWHPLLETTLRSMTADGVKHALAFPTSAYSSYSGCRQYREDVERARAVVGAGATEISFLRKFYNHPGFINANVDNARFAFNAIPIERRSEARIVFTAHSIPRSMAQGCGYEEQLQDACQLVVNALENPRWQLVYQSRSGSPSQPWLKPDISDHLRALSTEGVTDVVAVPIGFISDHMEVLYDIDVEARQVANEVKLNLVRAATVGIAPQFITMIRELIVERLTQTVDKKFLGTRGASHDYCPNNCCLSGQVLPVPNPSTARS